MFRNLSISFSLNAVLSALILLILFTTGESLRMLEIRKAEMPLAEAASELSVLVHRFALTAQESLEESRLRNGADAGSAATVEPASADLASILSGEGTEPAASEQDSSLLNLDLAKGKVEEKLNLISDALSRDAVSHSEVGEQLYSAFSSTETHWVEVREAFISCVTKAKGGEELTAEDQRKLVNLEDEFISSSGHLVACFFHVNKDLDTELLKVQIVSLALGVVLALFGFVVVRRKVVKPLNQATAFAKSVTSGDLGTKIEISGKDEVNSLKKELNGMALRLGGVVHGLLGKSNELKVASNKLIDSAGVALEEACETAQSSEHLAQSTQSLDQSAVQMLEAIGGIEKDTADISGFAREVTGSLQQAGVAVEQLSSNANSIATSVEEVASTLTEISQNTERTTKATAAAAKMANSSAERVNELGRSAEQVSKVIHLIKSVADQTNLLALNATIEAASAGEAGKGFAVVASEVKELARKTARATKEIQDQVDSMMQNTLDAVSSIRDIVALINELDQDFRHIAVAMDTQNHAVNEISHRLSDNADATVETNHNVHHAVESVERLKERMIALGSRVHSISDMVGKNSKVIANIYQQQTEIDTTIKHSVASFEATDTAGRRMGAISEDLISELGWFRA